MSKPSDNPADAFKKALAEASKVMANDPDLTVSYSVDPSGLSGDTMRLPQVSRRMTREEAVEACAKVISEYQEEVREAALLVSHAATDEGNLDMLPICLRALDGDRDAAREVLFAAHVRRSA